MIENLDLYTPDFLIDCKHLKLSSEVYPIMRKQGIKRAYVYGMVFNPKPLKFDFLKVGMSAPVLGEKREHQVGERIVRQASWIPGWDEPHPYSGNGSEFWHNINDRLIANNILPDDFNKNNLKIAVWDITARVNYNVILSDDEEFTLSTWAEGELAQQYKNNNLGKLPLLNITDPTKTKIYNGAYIPKDVFSKLFDFS